MSNDVKCITRSSDASLTIPAAFAVIHICLDQTALGWMKKPLCANGGINYRHWRFVFLDLETVPEQNICRTCFKMLTEEAA